ncbi:hypothetical protein HK103_007575 [Boothiomyces macroporosus]|uniref:Enkurin domain-containing protein n=1 Tax=Boothiomyces macroporosus TaxID=261099 RepID=A0AAD5UFT7_9FUNG|nr:hypothetical protein HK103_007575 [Boothiomyces macroporosus]
MAAVKPKVQFSSQAALKTQLEKKHDPRAAIPIPADPYLESVYSLIPEEYIAPPKEKRYKSHYSTQARKEYVSDTKKAASMGPAKVPLPAPSHFLKKRQGVPKKEGWFMPKKTKKESPSFLSKKDYGRTPEYLKKRVLEIKEAELNLANSLALKQQEQQQSALEEQGILVLPDEERERILKGLKENWEQLNNDYQRLSLTVDTVPKIARKVNMEQQLKQYEDLIDRFSHTNIHVSFNTGQ